MTLMHSTDNLQTVRGFDEIELTIPMTMEEDNFMERLANNHRAITMQSCSHEVFEVGTISRSVF